MSDHPQVVDPWTLSGMPEHAEDLLLGGERSLREGLPVPAHGVRWLRVTLPD